MFPKWVFNEIVKLIKKTLSEPAMLPRRYYSKLQTELFANRFYIVLMLTDIFI